MLPTRRPLKVVGRPASPCHLNTTYLHVGVMAGGGRQSMVRPSARSSFFEPSEAPGPGPLPQPSPSSFPKLDKPHVLDQAPQAPTWQPGRSTPSTRSTVLHGPVPSPPPARYALQTPRTSLDHAQAGERCCPRGYPLPTIVFPEPPLTPIACERQQ